MSIPSLPQLSSPPSSQPPPFLLALSGPTSSGKTTLARLLAHIFSPPPSPIIHCDNFYLPESQLPKRSGMLDWDSVASLDTPKLLRVLNKLRNIRKDNTSVGDVLTEMMEKTSLEMPPEEDSKEESDRSRCGITLEVVEELRKSVHSVDSERERPLVIVDGFLLFGKSVPSIRQQFDLKIFLPTPYTASKRRREARSGYITQEGFWQDPPDYFDKVVWPNYIEEHAFLSKGEEEDINEGKVDEEVVGSEGIEIPPDFRTKGEGPEGLEGTLRWLVKRVLEEL